MPNNIEELIQLIARRDSISENEAREIVGIAALDMETAFYNGDLGLAEEILACDLGLEPDYLMLFINWGTIWQKKILSLYYLQ